MPQIVTTIGSTLKSPAYHDHQPGPRETAWVSVSAGGGGSAGWLSHAVARPWQPPGLRLLVGGWRPGPGFGALSIVIA